MNPNPDNDRPFDDSSDDGRNREENANSSASHDQVFTETEEVTPSIQAQSEEVQQLIRAAEAEVLRLHAELENYRKRSRREMDDERRYAALPLVRDLLPVVDNLKRAIEHTEQQPTNSGALLTGVKMVAQQLESVLETHHCKRIAAADAAFDPNYHQAIGQIPSDLPAGTVAQVAIDGYQLHDRVVRPAQVLVSTGPQAG